tara:strand:+ start:767 stop:1117 length:351 start_codon:yes stop_codon:yes gene_type:complete
MARRYKNDGQDMMFGQNGSIFVAGTTAVTSNDVTGMEDIVFVAITFLEDTVFASGSGGLVAETEQLFPDDAGTGTSIDANGGAAIDSETFPKGVTIYGRWTGFTLASGKVIAYIGY